MTAQERQREREEKRRRRQERAKEREKRRQERERKERGAGASGIPSTDPLAGLVLSDNDRSLLERWTRMARPPAPTLAPAHAPVPTPNLAQPTSPPAGPKAQPTGPPLQPIGSTPGPQPACPPPGPASHPAGPSGPIPGPATLQTATSSSLLAPQSLVPTPGLPGPSTLGVLPYFPSDPPPPDPRMAPQSSTSESPDVNLVTQQLSKSQVRGEAQAVRTPGSGPRENGFGESLLFGGDREMKEALMCPCFMKTAADRALSLNLFPCRRSIMLSSCWETNTMLPGTCLAWRWASSPH